MKNTVNLNFLWENVIPDVATGILANILYDLLKKNVPKIKPYKKGDKPKPIDDLYFIKMRLINKIATVQQVPNFNLDNPTMNPYLIDSFYKTAIKVLQDISIDPKYFGYIKKNFSAYSVNNISELIGYLKHEMKEPKRNDSRYYMGLRSIYFVLRQNISAINVDYIDSVNNSLTPFYENYSEPRDLLL